MLDQIKGRFGGWWWCGLEGWRFVCGDVGEGASLHVTGGRDIDRAVSPPERPPPAPGPPRYCDSAGVRQNLLLCGACDCGR